ncbi:hypothetical protein ACFCX0_18690 [Streptomyces sp. NPDC056352]|uniref:hypothetical protein n=1 Tax=Streptomyces sp. NPDC056352 TaxID=3345791 RepID=UPI0035DE6D8C
MPSDIAHNSAGPSCRTPLRKAVAAGMFTAAPGPGLSGCGGPRNTQAAPAAPSATASGEGRTSRAYGHTDADYARVGLKRDRTEVWEDGFHTAADNDDPNAFEWWYSDFTGDDRTVSFTLQTRVDDGFVPDPGEAGPRLRPVQDPGRSSPSETTVG